MSAAAVAAIGHNNPPEPTPFERSRDEIEALFVEAGHWLDGSPVTTQAEADAVSKLMALAREAGKRADERRAEEKRPHDEAAAEVQTRFAALINRLASENKQPKGKARLIIDVCQSALAPFLATQEAEKQAKAAAAREAAERAALEAAAAFQATPVHDLAGRERAEDAARAAKDADAAARRAENDRAAARGGTRAVTLRTIVRAELTDRRAFLRWVAENRADELTGILQSMAERLSNASVRGLPGVTYHEERVAR